MIAQITRNSDIYLELDLDDKTRFLEEKTLLTPVFFRGPEEKVLELRVSGFLNADVCLFTQIPDFLDFAAAKKYLAQISENGLKQIDQKNYFGSRHSFARLEVAVYPGIHGNASIKNRLENERRLWEGWAR